MGILQACFHPQNDFLACERKGQSRRHETEGLQCKAQEGLISSSVHARLAFVEASHGKDGDRAMFTDRKRLHLTYPGGSVSPARWREGDEDDAVSTPNHPTCVNVY